MVVKRNGDDVRTDEQGRIHGYPSSVRVGKSVLEKVTRASGQELYAQNAKKR